MTANQPIARTDENLGVLSTGSYLSYFAQLARAFALLKQRFIAIPGSADATEQEIQEAKLESQVVINLLDRLLHSFNAIYYRAIYGADGESVLVDLTESGFPNGQELRRMAADTTRAAERLATLEPAKTLKRRLVDRIINQQDPSQVLTDLGERTYFERIAADTGGLFLLSTPMSVARIGGAAGDRRRYACAWGSYDTSTNRPYLYVLIVEQDPGAHPLDQPGPARDQFIDMVIAKGTGGTSLQQCMLELDAALNDAYPKSIKRFGIGPFYSELVFAARDAMALTPQELAVWELLRSTGNPEDLILTGTDEYLFAEREERVATGILRSLGLKKDIRQILCIPDKTLEARCSGVSTRARYAVLPHAALQNLPVTREGYPPELGADSTMLPYGEKGVLYV